MEYKSALVIGAGVTGLSVVRYLLPKINQVALVDDKLSESVLNNIQNQYSELIIYNKITAELLSKFDKIILSPGISPHQEIYNNIQYKLLSDIELFMQNCDVPVIGVTGTNGKSTVVSLLGNIFQDAGFNVGVGGNLGTPALDLLLSDYSFYILELSSFQLEMLETFKFDTACILNITPDHLDRHNNFITYKNIKQKIYHNAKNIVINRDDNNTYVISPAKTISFGLGVPTDSNIGVKENSICIGGTKVMDIDDLPILGSHNLSNVLAAIGIASIYKIPQHNLVKSIKKFQGLHYRCELIKTEDGIQWINDSKATNVGATRASIEGFAGNNPLILILGGDSKDQDFAELAIPIKKNVSLLIVYGRDKEKIIKQVGFENTMTARDFNDVIFIAKNESKPNNIVLFSPACASYDMFLNYIERGKEFNRLIKEL